MWEKFLTERDKEHLRLSGRRDQRPFGFGTRPAVLVVDDYYAALGTERKPILESVLDWPMSCGLDGWAAIDRTVDLLKVARQTATPVIYVTLLENFPSPWARETKNTADRLPEAGRERAYQIVDELRPHEGDLVIAKTAPSGFHGTPLLFHLNYLSIDTLLVCGETTSGCVRATVVDGATYRYRMGVIEECCFDRTEASHWINLFDMDQKYADVIGLEAATSYLRSPSQGGARSEPDASRLVAHEA